MKVNYYCDELYPVHFLDDDIGSFCADVIDVDKRTFIRYEKAKREFFKMQNKIEEILKCRTIKS